MGLVEEVVDENREDEEEDKVKQKDDFDDDDDDSNKLMPWLDWMQISLLLNTHLRTHV